MKINSLNLTCEEENQIWSKVADFEEQRHVEFINFGDDEKNIALPQFVCYTERSLPTIKCMDLKREILSKQTLKTDPNLPSELVFDGHV